MNAIVFKKHVDTRIKNRRTANVGLFWTFFFADLCVTRHGIAPFFRWRENVTSHQTTLLTSPFLNVTPRDVAIFETLCHIIVNVMCRGERYLSFQDMCEFELISIRILHVKTVIFSRCRSKWLGNSKLAWGEVRNVETTVSPDAAQVLYLQNIVDANANAGCNVESPIFNVKLYLSRSADVRVVCALYCWGE